MALDERFGLPLSLAEALRADPSPQAARLADLLEEGLARTGRPVHMQEATIQRSLSVMMAALALALGCATYSYAGPTSLEGRWAMAPSSSRFEEQVTGPAPDQAIMVVSRDDRDHLSYELDESRSGVPVAHGSYELSFVDALSTSRVDGMSLPVTAARDARGDVVIRAPAVDGLQALIRVRRTGPDTAILQHEVESAAGARELERISLVRVASAGD